MKVWYPGPKVDAAQATRTQLHPAAGELAPGLNEVADERLAASLVSAGLVRLPTNLELGKASPKASAPEPLPDAPPAKAKPIPRSAAEGSSE